jgi:hypothetical protein
LSSGVGTPTYYLRNYLEVAERVKRVVLSVDPEARVYVFSSAVGGLHSVG